MSIQEEKQLLVLVQDLCARTPYSQIVNIETIEEDGEIKNLIVKLIAISNTFIHFSDPTDDDLDGIYDLDYCDVKPYLRPMSSMTEEESKEFALLQTDFYVDGFLYPIAAINMVNWLNKQHLDYRGLIPMGLALEAPEGMYSSN